MTLKQQLTADIKGAMRAKESARLATLRMLKSAIQNKEIDVGKELGDDEVISVVSTLIKQRRDAAATYRENDRVGMAEQEEAEILLLQAYLPQQLTTDELAALIDEAIAETGASSPKDMGKVMQAVVPKTAGKADGKTVNQMVRAKLA